MTLIFIVGATATGKSALAIELAMKIGAEIVNADSMQMYKGMDIGTAKLPLSERAGIPHHLIDTLEITEEASVAQYQLAARECIDSLLSKSVPVIVVGGTGLYVKSILDELNFPETDLEIREKIQKLGEEIGGKALHKRLEKLDPAAAAAIPEENVRRVVRALEVIEITGKPFTANLPRGESSRYPMAAQYGLTLNREKLTEIIDERVEKMWQAGFVQEVKNLISKGLRSGKTARAAIGYSQIMKFLDGEMSEAQAREDTKRATRQYARRQETWFSRDSRIKWLSKEGKLEQILSTTLGAK
jgi:tRNA dimethylallyltransferase